jgi:hypothetical protein
MIKKCFALLIAIALFASMTPSGIAKAAEPIKVYMHGGEVYFRTAPIIKNNRTFVELRPIFTQAGIELHWDQSTQTVTGTKDGTTIKLTLGNKTAYINGKAVQLDAAPFAKNNYTFVPLRFVGEATGYKVDWHKTFDLIHIHEGKGFIEDRAFKEEQLTKEMLVTLREGRFPDFPAGLNDGIGGLLDVAGTPKIIIRETQEEGLTHQWMYGDYWFDFGRYDHRFYAIHVKPTRTTITIDEVLNALGPEENLYSYDGKQDYKIYAYYEGIYMYEFLTDPDGKVETITLRLWISDSHI